MSQKAIQERLTGSFSMETIDKLRTFAHKEFFAVYKRMTLKQLKDRKSEWLGEKDKDRPCSIPTIRLLLHGMDFSFIKLQTRTHVYMDSGLCRLQAHFLWKMDQLRKAGNLLIWSCNETWVHKGMRPRMGWQDCQAAKFPLTFLKNGLTAGNSAQWMKGERLVIVACLSHDGFRCPKVWRTGKEDDGGDYHKEMNAKVNTPCNDRHEAKDPSSAAKDPSSDNAAYHSRKYGVTLVRTPPYMAEYAPIEFGWGSMKKAMADVIEHNDDGSSRISEGALTFDPKELTVEEVVDAAEAIIDDNDEEEVVDLDNIDFSEIDED
ncbi:hypothetical protein PMAYCL1PPCAC_05032, partial [Pristionchus mayeri]